MALTVLIKPSSCKCNLRCRYCFYTDIAENREIKDYGFMSAEIAGKLIARAFETDEKEILFAFQGGEPMLIGLKFYELFVKTVRKYSGKRKKIYYTIQTNGTLIDDKFAAFFKKHGFLVGVSLDGNETIHDQDRINFDKKGSFYAVMRGIRCLERAKADFNIVAVVNRHSCGKIKNTYEFFKSMKFKYLQFIPCIDTVHEDSQFMMNNGEMFFYMSQLFDCWYEDIMKGDYVSIRNFDNYVAILQGRAPENCAMCGVCGNYFTVEADGSVFPCDFYCVDRWSLGNIMSSSFAELDNEVSRNFVKESLMKHKKCTACRYFFICRNGCKKDRIEGLNRYCEAYKRFFAKKEKQLLFLAKNLK